ncbi:kinetochore-associated protein 1-like [Liolophura sinensis]|uniref:kinetochore-associated protein 1-like n=1 Tax=Liolophura sinensis TaxID=3198878 RepID=UPI0031590ABC
MASSWDCVETDFGDETRNFGPRQESGSALYEVNTIATIGQREPNKSCEMPHLSAAVVGELIAVVANQHLSVFRDLQFEQTLEFDAVIDTLAWSPDGAFLVLGDCKGSLYVVEPNSQEVICNTSILPPNKIGGKTFQSIVVKKFTNGYDIVILSTSSQMFVIREATPAVFMDGSKSLQEKLTIEIGDLTTVHTRDTTCALFLRRNIITLGFGENIVGVWSSDSGQLDVIKQGTSFLTRDAGILSGCVTANEKFLLLLDEKKHLLVLNSQFMLLTVWDEETVEAFFLLESEEENKYSLEGVKVVMITSAKGKNCLQVKNLPGWDTAYTLQLFPTHLVESFPFQESLYIIEWCDTDENNDITDPHLRVRCLTEALPETRLIRLLNKNRFDEAMQFAKMFSLDTELVYKAKCKYLLDQVSAWNVGKYEPDVVKEMISDLHTCLSFIKDIADIVSLFTYVALPTLHDTHKILLYVKKLMKSYLGARKDLTDVQRSKATNDLKKLLEVIHRLMTYKLVYGQDNYCAERWERFIKSHLWEDTFSWFKQGELGKALAIWTRHQHDWVTDLTRESFHDLLTVIPENVTGDQLTSWITQDLLPFILCTVPKAFVVLLQWSVRKALNMERLEKEKWPVNAMKFLRSVHRAGMEFCYTKSATPAETVLRTQMNVTHALQSINAEIVKLQNMYDLQQKYKFQLTYGQFVEESTESVAFRMLDKVWAIELIPTTLKKQIRPYMIEHSLKEDDIFSKYIKDLLERMGRKVSYHGEARWEAKAVAVIKYIKSSELKCEAVLEVMKYASIPWTEDVQNLVQAGLKLDHPKVKLLKEQCNITRIKEILLKYELKKIKVEDLGDYDLSRIMKFILKKDGSQSVEDALRIIELKRLDRSHQVDVYAFRLRFLVEGDREHEAVSLVRSLPTYLSETCAKRLITYAQVILNEPIRWQPKVEEKGRLQFAAAGSSFCSYLTELLKDRLDVEEYADAKHEFDSLATLQTEFEEVVKLNDYRSEVQRDSLLAKHIQDMFSRTNQQMNALCYNKLFRLADVLQVGRPQLLGQLVLKAARSAQVDTAIDLCRMLLDTEPTPQTGRVMYDVARTLCVLQDNLASLESPPIDVLRRLPPVLNTLASQAVILCPTELIGKCLELCKVTDLSCRLCGQCEAGDYDLSEQMGDATSQDPYAVWNLDTVFREDALVLDSALALPLAARVTSSHMGLVEHSFSAHPKTEEEKTEGMLDLASSAHNLVVYLQKNGHLGLSVECLRQMMATALRCLLYQNEEKFDDAHLQLFTKGLSKCRELTSALLSKVLHQSHVDHRLALAYLTSLPRQVSVTVLKKGVSAARHNYKMIMSVSRVGIALSSLYRDPMALAKFKELEKNATWGHRLSKIKINFRDAFMAPSSEKTKLLPSMAQCESVTIDLIKDYCRSFQIEEDEGLLMYINHLLLTPPPLPNDLAGQQQQQAQLERARLAMQEVKLPDVLEERLHTLLLEQVNPYNYEVIQFLLEEILSLSPVSNAKAQKGLELLWYLKIYQRCVPPTEAEIKYSIMQESEELVCGLESLHPLSQDRLPYPPLMSDKPMSIIKPELNYGTVTQWIPMAKLLQIPLDNLYMAAIKNTVVQYKENNSFRLMAGTDASKISPSSWELSEAGMEMLRKVEEMLVKLSNCEMAMACCISSVISVLPVGVEKLVALEKGISYAMKWYKAAEEGTSSKERAKATHIKFSELYQRLATERILYQASMTQPELVQLANNPKALLHKLYMHPSILQHEDERDGAKPDIHEMAKKIAAVNSIQLEKIVNDLILECLGGESRAEEDTDATMNFTFTNMDFAKEEPVSEDEESSLRRVMYLLRFYTEEFSCQFLFHFFNTSPTDSVMQSNKCLVRALRCLLELADDATIERVCGKPAVKTRCELQVLMYLVDLDSLNIQHSLDSFTQCNKHALVKAVWQKHSHKKVAVQLVCDICLDYNIADVHLWSCVLQKLQAFGMSQKLENSLIRISGIRELWQIPSLAKVWQDVLVSFLNKGLPPLPAEQIQECARAINLLQKCPVSEELDLAALCELCNRVEMYSCALGCVTFMLDQDQQIQQVKMVMSAGLEAVVDNLRMAEEQGLSATMISRVENILFQFGEMTNSYDKIYGSERQQAFINYLIEKQDVQGLVEHLHNHNRMKEAGAVIDTYLEKCPTVAAHLRAACHGKSEQLKVQIFMQSS